MNKIISFVLWALVFSLIIAGYGGSCGGGTSAKKAGGSSIPLLSKVSSFYPANGAVDIPVNIALTWTAVSSATSYDIYFADTFTNLTAVTNTILTGYNPGLLTPGAVYYWKVNPKNSSTMVVGDIWSFVTEITGTIGALPKVASYYPANGAVAVPVNVTVQWTEVTGATSYDVFLDITTAGWTPVTVTGTDYAPGILYYNTDYYLRVDASNSISTTVGDLCRFTTAGQDSWATKAAMTTARIGASVGVANNRVYIISGSNANGTLVLNEEYNPFADAWQARANMISIRYDIAIGVVNNKLYAVGGYASDVLNENQEYDPAADSWSAKAGMTVARTKLGIAAVNDKIYAIGGINENNLLSLVNEEYNPELDSWATKAALPTARMNFGIGVVNNKIYVIGGTNDGYYTGALDINEEYNPSNNSWSSRAPMSGKRQGLAVGALYNKIYAIGGFVSAGYTVGTNEEYDPATNIWTAKANMPTGRSGLSVGVVNNKLYAIGGTGNGYNYLDTNEEYSP